MSGTLHVYKSPSVCIAVHALLKSAAIKLRAGYFHYRVLHEGTEPSWSEAFAEDKQFTSSQGDCWAPLQIPDF